LTDALPPLVRALKGDALAPPPLWLMRQAGRHLPEYLALREKARDFMHFCLEPELAVEATLQPIRRYGMDGAILFSDILTIPHALGQTVSFEQGLGPVLGALTDADLSPDAAPGRVRERLAPVFETVSILRGELPAEVALLGFAGAPWTLATYMLGGRGANGRETAIALAYRDPETFRAVLDVLVPAVAELLLAQIEAGVDAVQIFDSWAGDCPDRLYRQAVERPTAAIVRILRERAPETPIIGFPRGAGAALPAYRSATGIDCVGLDQMTPLSFVREHVHPGGPVQGALDPLALIEGGRALEDGVAAIREAFDGRPYVFNLGHGVRPETPIPHVERLVELVRN